MRTQSWLDRVMVCCRRDGGEGTCHVLGSVVQSALSAPLPGPQDDALFNRLCPPDRDGGRHFAPVMLRRLSKLGIDKVGRQPEEAPGLVVVCTCVVHGTSCTRRCALPADSALPIRLLHRSRPRSGCRLTPTS